MTEQKKIKPFYIDTYGHGLDIDESNVLVCKVIANNKAMYEVETHSDFVEGLQAYPLLCVEGSYGFDTVTVQSRSWVEDKGYFEEIAPEDIDTWLSHGLTKKDYVKESMKMLDIMQGSGDSDNAVTTVTTPSEQKTTLGLQPRKDWLQLREYEIVRALNRQVESCEELNEGWITELVGLVDLIGES